MSKKMQTDDVRPLNAGDFVPFGHHNPIIFDDGDEDVAEVVTDYLSDLRICAWSQGGFDGGEGDDAPENAAVELYAHIIDDGGSCDLLELLEAGFNGTGSGERAEIIALTKLRTGISKIIRQLRYQLKYRHKCDLVLKDEPE